MENCVVFLKDENYIYPEPNTLFRPHEAYPEYIFKTAISKEKNQIYDQVRRAFLMMGLDKENFGNRSWNPLGGIVKEGDNVLIKPNMVMDENGIRDNGTDCLYTNPSIVAAVIDYVWIALKGKGNIVIGDAPMQECRFDKLIAQSGYDRLVTWYKEQGVPVSLIDFRELTSVEINGIYRQTINSTGNGKIIDLGEDSEFAKIKNYKDLRITNYDPRILISHHQEQKNEYYVSNYILDADVIINMPKPKSHRKAGLTCAMKNFIGINVRKEYLPHHSFGSISEGGDEYLSKHMGHRLSSRLLDKRNVAIGNKDVMKAQVYKLLERITRIIFPYQDYAEGSWYGNHTISKTICDLNKIVLFADKEGKMQHKKQRKIFIVADMVVMGEKEGPISPSPRNVGVIAIGDNQVLFDEAVAEFVGFDKNKLPFLVNARHISGRYKLINMEDAACVIGMPEAIHLEPTQGWKGHIEIE